MDASKSERDKGDLIFHPDDDDDSLNLPSAKVRRVRLDYSAEET